MLRSKISGQLPPAVDLLWGDDMLKSIDTAGLEWARLVMDPAATDAECAAARARLDSLRRAYAAALSLIAVAQPANSPTAG